MSSTGTGTATGSIRFGLRGVAVSVAKTSALRGADPFNIRMDLIRRVEYDLRRVLLNRDELRHIGPTRESDAEHVLGA